MKKSVSVIVLVFVVSICFMLCGCEDKEVKVEEKISNSAYLEIKREAESFMINEKLFYNAPENNTSIKFLLTQNMFKGNNIDKVFKPSEKEALFKGNQGAGGVEIISVKSSGEYLPFSILGDGQSVLNVEVKNVSKVLELEIFYRVKLNGSDYLAYLPILPCIKQYDIDYDYNRYEPLVLNESFNIYLNMNDSEYSLPFEKENNLYSIKNNVDFCVFKTKEFKKQEFFVDQTKIEYYYKEDTFPTQSLKTIKDTFEFLNDIYKYEEKTFSVYEGAISECFSNAVIVSSGKTRENYLNSLTKLVAGVWFKKILLTDNLNEPYFANGLIEYTTILLNSPTQADFDKMMDRCKNNLINFEKNATKMNYPFKIDSTRKTTEYYNDYDYAYNTFTKSFLIFAELFNGMEREAVLNILQNYFERYAHTFCGYANFVNQIKP